MSAPARSGKAPPPVLAARPSDDHGNDSDNSKKSNNPRLSGTTRQKRTLVESACSACRRRKSRCDGERPSCSRCRTLHTECSYEAEEGESRWSALRRRNKILETERGELRELIQYLQTSAEPEAQDVFQRIRSGGPDDVFALLRQIREGHGPSQVQHLSPPQPPQAPQPVRQQSSSTSNSNPSPHQRLPPISTMFEVSGSYTPPPLPQPLMQSLSNGYEPSSAHSRTSRPSLSSHSSKSRGSDSSREGARDHDHPFRNRP